MKTWIEISKQNLLNNVREIIKNLKPETRFMAVLKSNAYGHGLVEVASLLLQFPISNFQFPKQTLWLGVDSAEEVLALQKIQGAEKVPTLILGYVPLTSLRLIPDNTRLTIYNLETIKALSKINKKFKVHVKVETGTQRQGIALQELPEMIKVIKRLKNIELEGVSSHFAEAENITLAKQGHSPIRANRRTDNFYEPSQFTKQQLKNFYAATQAAEKLLNKKLVKHIACSAAVSHFYDSQCDLVRVGINMYGLQSINNPHLNPPAVNRGRREGVLNLKPVLSWKTMVAQVKNVKKGTPIGYGRTEKMPYDGQIAILPIGYWDGYDRRLSSVGEVIIGGQRCKNIGRVCMNMSMALLPPKMRVKPEDEVVLIGKQAREEVTADQLAAKIGTINYEVVTRINPLISRLIN